MHNDFRLHLAEDGEPGRRRNDGAACGERERLQGIGCDGSGYANGRPCNYCHQFRRGLNFIAWLRAVDLLLDRACGMESADLPDWHYYDAWDSGMIARDAARAAIRAARDF